MNDPTWPRTATAAIATILVVTVIIVGGAAAAQPSNASGSADLGDIIWPPAGHRGRAVVDLGQQVLDNTTRIVAPEDGGEMQITRVDANTSNVTVPAWGSPNKTITFQQQHRPVQTNPVPGSASTRGRPAQVDLVVRPGQLRRTIQASISDGTLSVFGPPGSLASNLTVLLDKLGFPAEDGFEYATDIVNQEKGIETRDYMVGDSTRPCIERSAGNCTTTATLWLECENCTRTTYLVHPTPAEELEAASGGKLDVTDQSNFVSVTRTNRGRQVFKAAATLSFDLNTSRVVSPLEARDRVLQLLEDRGYRTNESKYPDVGRGRNSMSFQVNRSKERVGLNGARYIWGIIVDNTTSEATFTEESAQVTQNAVTGEVLSMTFEPTGTVAPPRRGGFPVPGWSPLAVVVAVGLAAAERRG